MAKKVGNVEWELFLDECFYDLWAVRPKKDKDMNSPRLFHFMNKEKAEQFLELIKQCHCAIPVEEQR